jgi:hypothetical protein
VNGYEGTGRSLSLKLIQQLRQQGAKLASGEGKRGGGEEGGTSGSMRTFREVILAEPIRCAQSHLGRFQSNAYWFCICDLSPACASLEGLGMGSGTTREACCMGQAGAVLTLDPMCLREGAA